MPVSFFSSDDQHIAGTGIFDCERLQFHFHEIIAFADTDQANVPFRGGGFEACSEPIERPKEAVAKLHVVASANATVH
jgi:hypothetical protein